MTPSARYLLFCLLGNMASASVALAENRFSVGVEGFRDHYHESDVDTRTDYGSVTANYTHDYNHFFSAIDARYSSGKADYKSHESGTLNGEPEWETDLRLRTGLDLEMWHGHLMPYVGVGWRYYFDEGKGLATNTGALAYDRHISQAYVPFGAAYRFNWGGWTFTPTAEADVLVWGRVSTHLAAIGVDSDAKNTQHNGWGLRGEFMAGQQYKYFGWEAGPFVRYWHIPDSNCVPSASNPGFCNFEPANTRLQAGGALRVNF